LHKPGIAGQDITIVSVNFLKKFCDLSFLLTFAAVL